MPRQRTRPAPRPAQKRHPVSKRPAVPPAPGQKAGEGKLKSRLRLFSTRSGMDLTFFILVLALVAIGLVMVFSASYANASYRFDNPYYFVAQQARWAVIGVVLMIVISFFDYHHLHRLVPLFALVTLVTLAITVVFKDTKLVQNNNGAYRWITIGSFSFQPSEIAKFTLVLLLAQILSAHVFSQKRRRDLTRNEKLEQRRLDARGARRGRRNLRPRRARTPHVRDDYFAFARGHHACSSRGAPLRWFAVGGAGIAGALLLMLATPLYSHVGGRIAGWLNPFKPRPRASTRGRRSSLCTRSVRGSFWGWGSATAARNICTCPNPKNDFIFAIVCEELGFIGALIIILMFGVLIWRGVMISLRAKDRFGMLLGIGLTMQVGIQVVLNIAVVTNTIPNTGISLPFFSAGGTSLVMLFGADGHPALDLAHVEHRKDVGSFETKAPLKAGRFHSFENRRGPRRVPGPSMQKRGESAR